jgi:hypothetical protein
VTALHVADDLAQAEQLRQRWSQAYADAENVRLQIVESPYRSLTGPLLPCVESCVESTRRTVAVHRAQRMSSVFRLRVQRQSRVGDRMLRRVPRP